MGLKELDLHGTNLCTLECGHCVFSSGERKLPQMGTDAIYALVDDFSSLTNHEGTINIFGGEILLRKDLIEIIQKVRSEGLKIGITTNCQVPRSIIDMVLEQDIQRITSDLDGATPWTHDRLRNKEGNLRTVIEVLKRAVEQRIFITVNSVLNTDNIHEVEEILELCRGLEISGLAFYYLTPTGRGKRIKGKCIDAKSWLVAKERVKNWVKQNNPAFTVVWEEAYENADSVNDTPWRCEKDHAETVFVRCDGEVYSCALLEGSAVSLGNVQREKLSAILAHREEKAFDRSKGCPALAFNEYQDVSRPDPRVAPDGIKLGCPYNCQILHGK